MLQCATGESVLRLEKTELAHEAYAIQKVYMHDQYHETLLQYLEHELPKAGEQSLYIQVGDAYYRASENNSFFNVLKSK